MSSSNIAWLQALAALTAEGLEPAGAQTLCAEIEGLERSRTLRRSPGFRLMRQACDGKPGSPQAWLLRYTMGRALTALAHPEHKPVFTLHAACTLLAERTGPALVVLAAADSAPPRRWPADGRRRWRARAVAECLE